MSGVSAMFILDDGCNLSVRELTGQSISHYSFQTISSWLRFTRHQHNFSHRDIVYGYFSKDPLNYSVRANTVNQFDLFLASNATTLKYM